MRTARAEFVIKEPDEWGRVIDELDLTYEFQRMHFEFGEYATIEVEFDEELRITGGRVVPLKQRR